MSNITILNVNTGQQMAQLECMCGSLGQIQKQYIMRLETKINGMECLVIILTLSTLGKKFSRQH